MPETKKLRIFGPRGAHESAAHVLQNSFQDNLILDWPDQSFYNNYNRKIVAKYTAKIPDGSLGIVLNRTIVDAVKRPLKEITFMRDVAAFEVAATQTVASLIEAVSVLPPVASPSDDLIPLHSEPQADGAA